MMNQFVLEAIAQLLVHASMPAYEEYMHFRYPMQAQLHINTASGSKIVLELRNALYEYRRHNLMLQTGGRSVACSNVGTRSSIARGVLTLFCPISIAVRTRHSSLSRYLRAFASSFMVRRLLRRLHTRRSEHGTATVYNML